MPLVKSSSDKAFKSNLKKEMHSGKPQKQALAIAYSTKRANMKSKGGMIKNDQSREVFPGGGSSRKAPSRRMEMNDQSPETYYRGGMTDDSREQHNSDCPDCMAMGGMCYSHGGMAQPAGGEPESDRPTKDLYPSRRPMAEGGEVDDMLPLAEPRAKRHHDEHPEEDAGGEPISHRPTRDMYAEGGKVDDMHPLKPQHLDSVTNEDLDPEHESNPKDLEDYGMSSEEASNALRDMPQKKVDISLVEDIMANRRRMAKGGLISGKVPDYESDSLSSDVGQLHGPIDEPTDSDMDNDEDEKDAPYEDGRYQRGLNLEPVHIMEDDEHDTSDASLVAEILKDRKMNRRGR